MYLKRLELLGFKSFASRTVLELDRGVTALVGPNGSGKSNVVDAVKWALGEQSLRAIRGRKSEDVIFAGNSKRAPTGMAEVTLVLDNSGNHFPLPFAEIAVTRRQYRSGEGEYLINRNRARLKDIVELLSHASLGADSYAVVNQGAVDEVLLQRPDERRVLLEAAADISRHQAKLRDSMDKLAETERNIRRVEDIREEIGPRLAKLRTQANRAKRYEEHVARLRTMVLWRYLLQIRQLRGRFGADMELEREKGAASRRASESHEAARQQAAAVRQRLRTAEAEMETAKEQLGAIRLARATAEREAALLEERERSLRRQMEETEGELARAVEERAELRGQIDGLEAQRREWAEREAAVREKMAPVEAERRQIQSEERYLRAQLDRTLAEQRSGASRRSELKERCNALAREANRIESARTESEEAASQASRRLEALDAELTAAREALQARREDLSLLETRHKDLQERLRSAVVGLEAARREERGAWQRDNDLRNRLSMLRSIEEQHRGLPAGAKAILEAGLPGVRGTLASTIQVPDEYVQAVSAALGSAQSYVVAEGFEEGLGALRYAAKRLAGATVAPLRLEKRQPARKAADELLARMNGTMEGLRFRGIASDLVSCPPEARDLCVRYLGMTLVVERMEDALEAYGRLSEVVDGRFAYQLVTMDGQVLHARGEMSVTASGDAGASLVARNAELASLSDQSDAAAAVLKETREKVAALEAVQAGLSAEAAAASAELSRLRSEIERQNGAYTGLASQVGKLEAAIEWNRTRVATLDREAAQNREAVGRAEKELAALEAKADQSGSVVEQLQGDLAALQSAYSDAAGRLSRLQADLTAAQNRARELSARVSAHADSVRRSEERVRRQEERVAQLSRALAELAETAKPVAGLAPQAEIDAAEKRVAAASALLARVRQQYDAAEAEASSIAGIREAASEELAGARSRLQRTAAEMSLVLREAARESGTEMDEAAEPETEEELLLLSDAIEQSLSSAFEGASTEKLPRTLAEVSSKVDSLRKELQSIGTINAEAPEEYAQLSERFQFLAEQLEDLRSAERTLRKASDELRELMEARFRETFNLVNAEFGRCFSMLFGGGNATLVLTEPDQPLSGGVDVLANLPGKKTTSLLGFSGGERALTAVALLFAMMKVNPSPFCLLDEVDAALDESNVRRFCQMLKGLSGETQFLLITHNRTTMEMAGALYGVSMLADSTSRVMSLRLNGHEREP